MVGGGAVVVVGGGAVVVVDCGTVTVVGVTPTGDDASPPGPVDSVGAGVPAGLRSTLSFHIWGPAGLAGAATCATFDVELGVGAGRGAGPGATGLGAAALAAATVCWSSANFNVACKVPSHRRGPPPRVQLLDLRHSSLVRPWHARLTDQRHPGPQSHDSDRADTRVEIIVRPLSTAHGSAPTPLPLPTADVSPIAPPMHQPNANCQKVVPRHVLCRAGGQPRRGRTVMRPSTRWHRGRRVAGDVGAHTPSQRPDGQRRRLGRTVPIDRGNSDGARALRPPIRPSSEQPCL